MIAPYLTFFILGMIVGGLFGAFVILLFQARAEIVEENRKLALLVALGLDGDGEEGR